MDVFDASLCCKSGLLLQLQIQHVIGQFESQGGAARRDYRANTFTKSCQIKHSTAHNHRANIHQMQQLRNMNARIVLDKKVCWTTRIMNLHVSNPSVCSTHQVSQTTNCIRQDLFPLVYPCSLSLTSAWHVLGRSICWFVCLWVSLKEKAFGSSWDGFTKCILTWTIAIIRFVDELILKFDIVFLLTSTAGNWHEQLKS